MTPATTRATDAEAWRRLVWWSRVTDEVQLGHVAAVLLGIAGVFVWWLFGVPHVVIAAVVVGVVAEVVRRICDGVRRRTLDAAAQLGSSRGLSREALEQAAARLKSGRIEELEASLVFDGDPLRQAIEGAFGLTGVSLAPLCGPAGARAVVVSLGGEWAAVLRFEHAGLAAAHMHRRQFAWDGAGPRPLELEFDGETRASLERSLEALSGDRRDDEVVFPRDIDAALTVSNLTWSIGQVRRDGEKAVRVGLAIVTGEGHAQRLTGTIELGGKAPVGAEAVGRGPYRTTTGPAAPAEVVEIEVEERPCRLAPAPSDGPAENVLVHAVVHAAARAVRPLVLVPKLLIVKGRPLRVDGVPRVAGLRPGAEWIDPLAPIAADDPAQRAALAQKWLHAGSVEHASIAAFERLARVLAELGAPASLVDRARAAMADEARHARDAFSLAAAYGGPQLGPGPLAAPDETPEIDALAIETFVDGCVGETTAARAAAAALERCEVPAAREVLTRVAVDERRHAELAWEVLEWLLPRTSERARVRIAGESPPRVELSRRETSWLARHGWLTHDDELAVAIVAWVEEIGPRRAALLRRVDHEHVS